MSEQTTEQTEGRWSVYWRSSCGAAIVEGLASDHPTKEAADSEAARLEDENEDARDEGTTHAELVCAVVPPGACLAAYGLLLPCPCRRCTSWRAAQPVV